MQTIKILGVRVDGVDCQATLQSIAHLLDRKQHAQICTVNPEFIMRAQRDLHFRDVLAQSNLNVPDGIGVLWAARRRGMELRERVTGSDMLPRICERAAQEGWPVFLLGAAEGVAERCAVALQVRFAGLNVVGTRAGSSLPEGDDANLQAINQAGPQVLFVAYGAPAQDLWIARNLSKIRGENGLVAMGVGGAYDFLTGVQTRAPAWVQQAGFEWLYRLLREPWRFKRQLAIPQFIIRNLIEFN